MKRLVLCCDGTWNTADQQRDGEVCPTNVVKLAYQVARSDGATTQVVYYDQGVGTGNWPDRISGGAFGAGLERNLEEAYRFLMENYEPGDQIFLFGFSRGAYTVRSLAGMIRNCGILAREHLRRYPKAVDLYRNPKHPDDEEAVEFRRKYSVCGSDPIAIRFIGVWDTVGALGIPLRGLRWLTRQKYQFHDVELSGIVERAYHALAIDEHRAPFEPAVWKYKLKPNQVVEQVWFCGAHSDVGGGYRETGLSDITLEWMMGKAKGAGLVFDRNPPFPIRPDALAEVHDSKTGLYCLTRGIDRTIDPQDPTQWVHESARKRWDEDPSYRPRTLVDYFKKTRDPRGEEVEGEGGPARSGPGGRSGI